MNMFEKVEKLREKADVTYEEARDALEKTNGDILEAMILLEKDGKAKNPGSTAYSTEYERSEEKEEDKNGKERKKKEKKDSGEGFVEKMKNLFRKSVTNYLVIKSKDGTAARIPLLVAALVLIFAWYISVIAIIVSLFFGCKYSFEGEDEMEAANKACEKAEEIVADIVDVTSEEVSEEDKE